MIVPMKKVFCIVQEKDVVPALSELRELGIVHVEHHVTPLHPDIGVLKEKNDLLGRVLTMLSRVKDGQIQQPVEDWEAKAREIIQWKNDIDHFNEEIARRNVLISHWEQWGHFDPQDIEALKEKGVHVVLAEMPVKDLASIPEGVVAQTIFTKNKVARVVLVSREEIDGLATVLNPPSHSLGALRHMQQKDHQAIEERLEKIRQSAAYADSLQKALIHVQEELAFQEAFAGRGQEESLAVLKGFCPREKSDHLRRKAQEQNWGVLIEDPSEEDQIPTLLRNPRWVEMVKPVFHLINVLPGYKEFDVSLCFLLFFSVFFGILIGDAGYGLFFALATLFFQLKSKGDVKNSPAFALMYVLSACTIVWGLMTGTFFGQQWLQGFFSPLVPWVNDTKNLQMLCFLIGAVHLSIAHVWRAIMLFPSLSFLAQAGWLLMVWGMYFVARLLILGIAFPAWGSLLIYGGIFGVVFFTKPNKNPLKAMGPGIGDFLLNAVNTFTDVVSYIRLFAVGLATVAVADAFNDMVMGIGFGSVVAGIISALILIVGHLFNIALGSMAILVHGLRLNVLEFSNHLDMQWSGFKYNPLRKSQ